MSGWLKLGAVLGVSVVIGGLGAAWWVGHAITGAVNRAWGP
jgi:hypothetical protein